MTYTGRIVAVNRFGISKTEAGVLAKSSFEETAKHLFNAAVGASFDDMRGVSANIMFGQKPPGGTGYVDILLDETRLPEGDEPGELPKEALARLNEKLATKGGPAACDLQDILMEW